MCYAQSSPDRKLNLLERNCWCWPVSNCWWWSMSDDSSHICSAQLIRTAKSQLDVYTHPYPSHTIHSKYTFSGSVWSLLCVSSWREYGVYRISLGSTFQPSLKTKRGAYHWEFVAICVAVSLRIGLYIIRNILLKLWTFVRKRRSLLGFEINSAPGDWFVELSFEGHITLALWSNLKIVYCLSAEQLSGTLDWHCEMHRRCLTNYLFAQSCRCFGSIRTKLAMVEFNKQQTTLFYYSTDAIQIDFGGNDTDLRWTCMSKVNCGAIFCASCSKASSFFMSLVGCRIKCLIGDLRR